MSVELSSEALAAMRELCAHSRSATMDELAAAAGVSVRTLYRAYRSREGLLRELDREPARTARERVMEAALELVGRRGLAALSMDELADAAGVSRATLYRIFPGKPALFQAVVQSFSPWIPLAQVITTATDRSPEHVIPELAQALLRVLAGRTGLLMRMVSELADEASGDTQGVQAAIGRELGTVIGYLDEQMAAGSLRRLDPGLAFQLLAGPIVAHLLTRPLAVNRGIVMPPEQAVDHLTKAWLRAMAPGKPD